MKTWLVCAVLAASLSVAEADEIEVLSAVAPGVITVGGLYTNADYNGSRYLAEGCHHQPRT